MIVFRDCGIGIELSIFSKGLSLMVGALYDLSLGLIIERVFRILFRS